MGLSRSDVIRIALAVLTGVFPPIALGGPGDDCLQEAQKDLADCQGQVGSYQGLDGQAPSTAPSGNTINQGASQSCAPQAGQQKNQGGQNAGQCAQDAAQCHGKCAADQGQVPGYCQSQQQQEQCMQQENQKIQQGQQICGQIDGMGQQLGQAAAGAGQGQQGCNQTDKDSKAQMPPIQMPQQQQQQQQQQTPQVPTPSVITPAGCTGSATMDSEGTPCPSAVSAPLLVAEGIDIGGQPSFASSIPASATASDLAPAVAEAIPNPSLGGGGLPGRGGGGGGGGAPSAGGLGSTGFGQMKDDLTKAAKIKEPFTYTATVPTDGGGGGGGGSAPYEPVSLSEYLPGHSKDPKRSPAGMVSAHAVAHPDIASKYSVLFDLVSKHMQLKCRMKELIGCD